MADTRTPLKIFIPKYAKLSGKAKFGLFIFLIIGPCYSSLFFEQLSKLLTNGISRILDVMMLGIYAIFGCVWIIWIYQLLTRIKRLEFFDEHFVIHWRVGYSKLYNYYDVIDLHPNSVKIGVKLYRFSFFENGKDLHEIFTNLARTRKIDKKYFSGEIEYSENLLGRAFRYSKPIAVILTIFLLIFIQFNYVESKLLFPFVLLGVIWISYWFIKFLDNRK